MNNDLTKDILSTVIYYDILGYPMTAFEVWKYLGVFKKDGQKQEEKISLVEVTEELEKNEALKRRIESHQGFYFLRGRQKLVEERLRKNKISAKKMKILKRVVFWLRFLPYVRMIGVTGTVAMKNADKKSDLDLLIVLAHGRLFIGRTILTAFVHLIGKRRYSWKITDRICLNCFLTGLSLESRLKDAFSASEYFFIRPIFGQKTFLEFQGENGWIREFKSNFRPTESWGMETFSEKGFSAKVRRGFEKIFNGRVFELVEEALSKWQTARIAKDPRTAEKGSIIMADSDALIFFHRAHGLKMESLFRSRLADMRQRG